MKDELTGMRDAAERLLAALNMVDALRLALTEIGVGIDMAARGGALHLTVRLPAVAGLGAEPETRQEIRLPSVVILSDAGYQRFADDRAEVQPSEPEVPADAPEDDRCKGACQPGPVEAGPEPLPAQAAEAEPVPAPEPEAPAALRGGPWSDAELVALEAMLAAGRSAQAIAAELNRHVGGVGAQIGRLKGKPTRPSDVPKAKPAVSPGPLPVPPHESVRFDVHVLRERLDALGHNPPWSIEKDLRLAETIAAGDGVGNAAALLRIPRDICLLRWHKLLPDKGVDQQEMLLAELRRRAASASA